VADGCGNQLESGTTIDVVPFASTAGDDLDERSSLDLSADYRLPPELYDALEMLDLEPTDLFYPDAGATFDAIPTRLDWTDTLRHQGDLAPIFGAMVAEQVEAALAQDEGLEVRELLVAQQTFNVRDELALSRFDRRITLDAPESPLLEAVRLFLDRQPVEGHPSPPSTPWAELEPGLAEQIDRFPYEAQAALALAIGGLLEAAELRDRALLDKGVLTMDQWGELQRRYWSGRTGHSTYSHEFGTEAHPGLDLELLSRAGQVAVRVLESLRLALAGVEPVEGAELTLEGSLGRVRISLDGGDDQYIGAGDDFLLVDLAGDDTYLDHIATNAEIYYPVAAVLDLSGDDRYGHSVDWTIDEGQMNLEATRMQGAGIFGVAVLIDGAGDDSYHASGLCQGMGAFGVGVLADHGGADTYSGYTMCQGSADFGYGLLVDLGDGRDQYETWQKSQGYGGPRGMGWLVDEAGDDHYLAIAEPIIVDWAGEGSNWSGSQGFGFGVRDGFFTEGAPIFSGGLGALFDLDGDDSFQCAVMCQGFGYAFGTGLFYDRRGDDDHLITHKYALGSATHWAVGLYLDGDGDDSYRNDDDDECIGLGYDASVAFHIDRGNGDDVYTLDNFGDFVLGQSRIPALGVLINEGGDDEYHVPGSGSRAIGRTFTQGGNREGYLSRVISLGMFLDLGGTDDWYDIARDEVDNDTEWIQTEPTGEDWDPRYDYGYGLDLE
jgi:hypothetical protein